MPALVVPSEHEESVGVAQLQAPQVQHTLQGGGRGGEGREVRRRRVRE